jgi:hypothetical protein
MNLQDQAIPQHPAPKQSIGRRDAQAIGCSGDDIGADCDIVEMHLRILSQLFDSLDPSPFHEKDLDRDAEEYIVDSVKERNTGRPCALALYVEQPVSLSDEGQVVGDAIRVHFARRAQLLRRELRQLIRRGLISLCIGLAFLATVFMFAQMIGRLMGESSWGRLFREGLLIVGWVAMWRPLEIFLYDWWPVLGEQRLYDRLSRIKVRIYYCAPGPADGADQMHHG